MGDVIPFDRSKKQKKPTIEPPTITADQIQSVPPGIYQISAPHLEVLCKLFGIPLEEIGGDNDEKV